MKTKRTLRIGLATALTAAALGSVSACGSASAGGDATVRYQSYQGAVDPIQLAAALGKLPGIKLQRQGYVTGGPASLQALSSNQIDISAQAFFGAIAQVVATGAPIKAVVATYGTNDKTGSQVVVPATSSLAADPHSLIGKKVAVNTLGANAEAVLDTWFTKSGLTPAEIKQVTLVPLPPLNTIQALKQGQVDAAYLATAQVNANKDAVQLKSLVTDAAVVGNYDGGGSALRTQWIKDHRATAKTLVSGISASIDYIGAHTRQQVLDVYEPWLRANGGTDTDIAAVEKNWSGVTGVSTKGGLITDHDISIWLTWLGSRGDVDPSKVKTSDVYTNELNPNA